MVAHSAAKLGLRDQLLAQLRGAVATKASELNSTDLAKICALANDLKVIPPVSFSRGLGGLRKNLKV